MNALTSQTAAALAEAIRHKTVKSEDVVAAHLDRINKLNNKLNAIVVRMDEDALEKARQADLSLARGHIYGSLHGVPITVKESFEVKGFKTTSNFKPLKNYVSHDDAPVVTRLKDAGAIIIGKTNLPTLCADYQTFGPLYGRANNPHNLAYTPGGSTGGGAAAVAAGMSPLELGSDIGGSLRVPAHFCGLYAMKPTEFSSPLVGHIPPLPGYKGGLKHMACFGPIARSVSDLRLVFDIIKGPDYKDVRSTPIAWTTKNSDDFSSLRIAWTDTFGDYKADNETSHLLQDLVARIEKHNGNTIIRTDLLNFDFSKAWNVWASLFGFITGQDISELICVLLKIKYRLSYGTHFSKSVSKGLNNNFRYYACIIKERDEIIAQLQAYFETFNFLLCPVTMTPAFTHRKSGKSILVDGKKRPYLIANCVYTVPFNATGHPVVVIPVGKSKSGLPIGIQIIGPYWSDLDLLDFAETLSKHTDYTTFMNCTN